MPSTYYTFTQTLPGGDTVQFIMIDTETLTGGANPMPAVLPNLGYPAPVAPGRRLRAGQRRRLQQSSEGDPGADSPLDPPVPPSWVPPPVNEAQWAWIQATLQASTADWIIVVGHHPVWSVGEYGPTWPLVERLAPLMESAGVALYICGHEHQMEHFRSEPHDTGVDYLVVGNGAYYNDTAPTDMSHAADCPYGSLQFTYTQGTGFASLLMVGGNTAAPSQLSATLYDGEGTQLYAFYKANPRTMIGHTGGTWAHHLRRLCVRRPRAAAQIQSSRQPVWWAAVPSGVRARPCARAAAGSEADGASRRGTRPHEHVVAESPRRNCAARAARGCGAELQEPVRVVGRSAGLTGVVGSCSTHCPADKEAAVMRMHYRFTFRVSNTAAHFRGVLALHRVRLL